MMRVGLSHDPLRFYLSFYDVSFKKLSKMKGFLGFLDEDLHSGFIVLAIFSTF